MIARDLLIVVCGISAGIHAALAPEHFAEGAGAGIGFVAAAVGLASLAVVLTLRPPSVATLAASGALLAGLIVSYALAVSSGLPILHPEPDPVDALALATKAIEAAGLLAAWHLFRLSRSRSRAPFPSSERNPVVSTRSQRPIPLALTMLIALFSALTALAFAGGHDAHAHTSAAHHSTAVSPEELAFRNDMRKLWEDHVTWTRLAVVSLVAGSPDTKATVARLLHNQTDIGNAIKPFYGRSAGIALTKELRLHILIAADLIAAAKAGDQAKLAAEQARWRANAADIATLLSRANPHWKRAALVAMLGEHLRLTTQEVVARLQGKWAADVGAYDRIHLHALHMADTLSAGIKAQFPGRFR